MRVARMARRLRSRLAALIAVAEERILHVEMTLVRRNFHRLAHAAAGEMDGRRHVRELDEILQVLERAVAAPAVDVVDERRPADRREHRRVAAEAHVARRIARMQREFPRRGLEQMTGEAARNVHALALTSAPAPRHRRKDSGSRRNSMPISSRMVSALASMISTASVLSSSTTGSLRRI